MRRRAERRASRAAAPASRRSGAFSDRPAPSVTGAATSRPHAAPAAAEKVLKKIKQNLPDDLVVAVSSGSTLAPESDPRPSVVSIGHTLKKAMANIQ